MNSLFTYSQRGERFSYFSLKKHTKLQKMEVLMLLGVCENRILYKNKPIRRLYLPLPAPQLYPMTEKATPR